MDETRLRLKDIKRIEREITEKLKIKIKHS